MRRALTEDVLLVEPTTGRVIAPSRLETSPDSTESRARPVGTIDPPLLVDPTTGKVLPRQPQIQPNVAAPGFFDPEALKRLPPMKPLTDSSVSERNALWTTIRLPFLFDPLDVAVGVDPFGQRFVWVVGDGNEFARLDPGGYQFASQPVKEPLSSSAQRIAAGHFSVLCSTADGSILSWKLSGSATNQPLLGPNGAQDVAVSETGRSARVGTSSSPGAVLVLQGTTWVPVLGQDSAPVSDGERISFGTRDDKITLWVCKSDGSVSIYYPFQSGSSPTDVVTVPPAFDVGAHEAGWVLARSTPMAPAGCELWKVTPLRARKVLDSGVTAVDVDPEGNPWVVDAQGRIKARGIQVLAFHPVARELPPSPSLNPLEIGTADAPEYWKRWNEAFRLLDELGAAGAVILQPWSLVDPAGVSPADPDPLVEANWGRLKGQLRGYVGRGFRLLVNIAPIFTGKAFVPPAFTTLADSEVIARYGEFIDRLEAEVPGFHSSVDYWSIGNEVDVFLSKNNAWGEYKLRFDLAVDVVRAKLPRAKIGVTMTLPGSVDWGSGTKLRPEAEALVEKSDVLIFTYYPYSMPFSDNLNPSRASDAFGAMRALAQTMGKPVVLQEVGYSSAPEVHGLGVTDFNLAFARHRQAQFLAIVLDEWAKSGPAIPFLSWFSLHDHYFNPNWNGNMLEGDAWNYVKEEGDEGFGSGNLVAPFFFGDPLRTNWMPAKPVQIFPPVEIDSWMHPDAVRFSHYFASSGLLTAAGATKSALSLLDAWVAAHRK